MTPQDRRAIGFGAVVLAAAWLGLRGVPRAVTAWRGARTQFDAGTALLQDTREALEALPRMEDSARALTPWVARMAPKLLVAGTEALALSDLAGRLRVHAARHQIRILDMVPTADTASAGRLHRVRLTLRAEGDFTGFLGLLEGIGADTVVLVVERLGITAHEPWADAGQPERLGAELTVSAWYLAGESAS